MKHQLSEIINLLKKLTEKLRNVVEGYPMQYVYCIVDNSREYKREKLL